MDEEKRKQLEAKLYQLFSQANQAKEEPPAPIRSNHHSVTVIRRRKGNPDIQIA